MIRIVEISVRLGMSLRVRETKKGRAAARFFNSGSRAGPRAPRCVDQNRGAGKGQSRPGWGQNVRETLRLWRVEACPQKWVPVLRKKDMRGQSVRSFEVFPAMIQ